MQTHGPQIFNKTFCNFLIKITHPFIYNLYTFNHNLKNRELIKK